MTNRKVIAAALIGSGLITGCATKPNGFAGKEVEIPVLRVHPGYNALEAALTDEGNLRNRLLTNLDFSTGDLKIGYHGVNEMEDLDPDTYFGIHRIHVGKGTRGEAKIKTNSKGIVDAKFGIRDTTLPMMIGCYGYTEAVTHGKEGEVAVFLGKGLGKGFFLEAFMSASVPYDSDKNVKWYHELELKKSFGDHYSVFLRGEIKDFNRHKTGISVGLTYRFK